jgi:transcriptional regulator with XRE-family HTH domain
MNEPGVDGARAHRHLRSALRRHRAQVELTQQDVAAAMEWSVSKVIRIELGDSLLSSSDLRHLLDLYRVVDSEHLDQMLRWARAAKHQPWRAYRDVHSASFLRFLAYEASASRIWHVQPHFVPGLFQSERYARALLSGSEVTARTAVTIDRLIDVRLRRQKILQSPNPPVIVVFLDESVIRRVVGGPAVMREQLEYLTHMSRTGQVSLRVMPFAEGVYPGVRDAFVRMAFEHPEDPEVLYVESAGDSVTRDEMDSAARTSLDLGAYQKSVQHLEAIALPEEASTALIRAAIATLSQD